MPTDATLSEKDAVNFYLYKGDTKIEGPSSVGLNNLVWDLSHLDYGTYIVYETTPADFAPVNTGGVPWTEVSGNGPDGIQVADGQKLYRTEIGLAEPGGNGGTQIYWLGEFINKRIPGRLTVKKLAEGMSGEQEFHFQLVMPNGLEPVDLGGKYDTAGDGSKIESAPYGMFKLKAGETITFTGLILGARYSVREIIRMDDPYYLDAIEGDVNPNNAEWVGDINAAASPDTITFKNKSSVTPTPIPSSAPEPSPTSGPGTPAPEPSPTSGPGTPAPEPPPTSGPNMPTPTPAAGTSTPEPSPSPTPGHEPSAPTPTSEPGAPTPTSVLGTPTPVPPPPGGGDISDDPSAVPPGPTAPGGNTPTMPVPVVPTEEVPMGPPVTPSIPNLIGLQEEDEEPPLGAPEVPHTGGEAADTNSTGILAALGALILALKKFLNKKKRND
jgi:hypothetical protein